MCIRSHKDIRSRCSWYHGCPCTPRSQCLGILVEAYNVLVSVYLRKCAIQNAQLSIRYPFWPSKRLAGVATRSQLGLDISLEPFGTSNDVSTIAWYIRGSLRPMAWQPIYYCHASVFHRCLWLAFEAGLDFQRWGLTLQSQLLCRNSISSCFDVVLLFIIISRFLILDYVWRLCFRDNCHLPLYLWFKASFAYKCASILASEDVAMVDGAGSKSLLNFQL